jgi:phosphomannomutase
MDALPIMSVSGIRGILGTTITPQFCAAIAYLQTQYLGKGEILVARDTRPSGEELAKAIFCGIRAAGGIPVDIGIAPTPTACVAVQHRKASGGIIITASHNPSQYNGYKMIHPSGRLFKGSECDDIYRAYNENAVPLFDPDELAAGKPDSTVDAVTIHLNKILPNIDVESIRRAKLTVAVDSINGAGGVMFPELLAELGVSWIGVHNKIDGDFVHNPEPRPEHLTDLAALMKKTDGLCAGFIFDPDADRLATMGEHGEPVSEEMTLILAASAILARQKSPVATNLSTSMMIDDVAKMYGVPVVRTKIGEANVVEALLAHKCVIGGEGNGGVIYPAISIVRDGMTGIALILENIAKTGKTLMQLVSQWKQYPIVKDKISCEGKNPAQLIAALTKEYSNETIDVQDGLKIIRDYGWVHIRPSNTEPILRCYAEAHTEEQARQLVAMIMSKI